VSRIYTLRYGLECPQAYCFFRHSEVFGESSRPGLGDFQVVDAQFVTTRAAELAVPAVHNRTHGQDLSHLPGTPIPGAKRFYHAGSLVADDPGKGNPTVTAAQST
jgi:hypothetical protein